MFCEGEMEALVIGYCWTNADAGMGGPARPHYFRWMPWLSKEYSAVRGPNFFFSL